MLSKGPWVLDTLLGSTINIEKGVKLLMEWYYVVEKKPQC
jgi:hypothetical protein